uniref:Cation-transporting P-type ATPase N-terminal domain-containing protein n=1 Tax=Triticum urartu TaxID=4572 RepID=A0A8R7Q272_TRIUA
SHCRCCHHGHHRALIPPSLLVSSHRAGCRRAALLSRRAGLAELVVSANRDISSEDAAARLQRYGPNKLEWPERPISTITRNPSLPPFPWRGMPSKRSVRCVCGGHGVAAWFKGMPWLLPMLSVWTGQIQRWVHDCDIILRGRKTTVAFTVLGCAARLICIVLMVHSFCRQRNY